MDTGIKQTWALLPSLAGYLNTQLPCFKDGDTNGPLP